ncbi:MAG: hypothetical protein P9L97_06935 [Candidatus Tenebribacter davisii]|nr:hypothetical protein [Candidatus Tenebribacter davisii]
MKKLLLTVFILTLTFSLNALGTLRVSSIKELPATHTNLEVYVLRKKIKVFINSNFIAEVEDYRNYGIRYFYFLTRGIARTHFDNLAIHQLWLKN